MCVSLMSPKQENEFLSTDWVDVSVWYEKKNHWNRGPMGQSEGTWFYILRCVPSFWILRTHLWALTLWQVLPAAFSLSDLVSSLHWCSNVRIPVSRWESWNPGNVKREPGGGGIRIQTRALLASKSGLWPPPHFSLFIETEQDNGKFSIKATLKHT